MGFIKSLTWLHTETANMLGDRFIGNPVFQESPKHANACAGRIIIPVKLFQRCKIHCSQCKHFKIYVAHGHDSNMARHLYPQLCFLWPFQDSSVATSPGRFVWESFASLWVSLPPDGDMGLSPEDAPRAGKLEINLTYIHPQRHLRELWEI